MLLSYSFKELRVKQRQLVLVFLLFFIPSLIFILQFRKELTQTTKLNGMANSEEALAFKNRKASVPRAQEQLVLRTIREYVPLSGLRGVAVDTYIAEMVELASSEGMTERTELLLKNISAFGDKGVNILERVLNSRLNINAREAAAQALAMIGSETAVNVLLNSIIAENSDETKDILARSLQLLDNPESGLALINTIVNIMDDYTVLSAIREAIPRIGNSDVVRMIVKTYQSQDIQEWQKLNLLSALSEIRDVEAVAALGDIIGNGEDSRLQEQAAITLGQIGAPHALEELLIAIEEMSGTNMADIANQSIGSIRNKESLDLLMEAFDTSGNVMIKNGVIIALANGDAGQSEGDNNNW